MRSIIQYTPTARSVAPASGFFGRSPWAGLEGEIDRWFENALSGIGGALSSGTQFPVDLYEDKDNTYVRAELPGVNRDDINVEMVEGYLSITALRKHKAGGSEESFSFSRSVAIPEAVQADKVAAAYENGVLLVTLPKREEAKPRKVAIEVK